MNKFLFAIVAAVILLSGCNKSETTNGKGNLSVKITDDPFNINYVESATVTITKIELRKVGDTSGSPFVLISENPVTVDLMGLRNGITRELANLDIAPGTYDLVRLYVGEAGLKIKDQADAFHLKIPSGSQTGIKVFVSPVLLVEGGLSSELLLDFDLSKSFVMRGNMTHSSGVNGFIFKPCIRAVNNTSAGRIEGFVGNSDTLPVSDAKVWVQKDTVITTAFTDESGYYVLPGIPAGTYSVLASQAGYDTASAENVVVYPGNKTIQDLVLINPLHYVSSVIENATPDILVMTYSLTLADIIPDTSSFTVTVNSGTINVNSVAIDGANVVLTLASPVVQGDVVTVGYSKPDTNPLQTDEGSQAASLTPRTVTNNVMQ